MKNFAITFLCLSFVVSLACSRKKVQSVSSVSNEITQRKSENSLMDNKKEIAKESQDMKEQLIGFVSIKGTTNFPMVIFTAVNKDGYLLNGPKDLVSELQKLQGLRVEIFGEMIDSGKPLRTFVLKGYKLIPDEGDDVAFVGRINGIGVIIKRDDGVMYKLKKIPDQFCRENSSALLWIKGKKIGEREVSVSRFGVIEK